MQKYCATQYYKTKKHVKCKDLNNKNGEFPFNGKVQEGR